ncbi:hypothetical protein EVAR_8164_1 [Eumeta japonica]|uniref:Uncharacterized protein n=1 Tax=Eumeta variegata TaxID=151549 RepID=A0A4C1TSV8_EUMVA|nr:hypothetical protein EVAR_8164_1 [Eumeta japonica]
MEQARALKASMWPDDHEISRRIDKSIMDLIIVDMLPYSIVDSHAALITDVVGSQVQNTYLNSDEVDIATMEIENHMRIYADNSRETAGTSGQEPSSSYRLSPYEKMAGFGMSMTNRLVKQFKVLMQ